MADPQQPASSSSSGPSGGEMFAAPARQERSFPTAAVAVAAVAVLVLATILILAGRRHSAAGSPDTLRPVAAYAGNLKLTNFALSESTSFSGGKSTFLDGHITNAGPATVTGITAQVLFSSDSDGAPQLEQVPVTLIRTRKPYLDTEPMSAAPLAPGAGADFRLTFEGIRPEWNQQMPVLHIVDVATR